MLSIWDMVDRVAETDVPVLIRGESGVGKEGIARTLHERSPRRVKPFVKINCAALPSELLESELFGHERGAFTGATSEKPGKFELADKGTIFLDEIGEMHPALQAKLLQVLQDEEYYRVGGKRALRADARVVVATNRVLENEISRGNFREDLYYRLNVVSVLVPPLRDRKEDIPGLIEHFRRKVRQQVPRRRDPVLRRGHPPPGRLRLPRQRARVGEPGPPPGGPADERFVLDEADVRDQPQARDAVAARRRFRRRPLPPANQGRRPLQPGAGRFPGAKSPPTAPVVPMGAETVSLRRSPRQAGAPRRARAISAMLARTTGNKPRRPCACQISYKALLYKIKDCGLDRPAHHREPPGKPGPDRLGGPRAATPPRRGDNRFLNACGLSEVIRLLGV